MTRPEDLLFIEAHEADIVVANETAAIMLEAPMPHTSTQPEKGSQGSGLIKWEAAGSEEAIWVDRCVHKPRYYLLIDNMIELS